MINQGKVLWNDSPGFNWAEGGKGLLQRAAAFQNQCFTQPESGAPRAPFPEALPAAPLSWVKFVPGLEWRSFRALSGQGLSRQKPRDTAGGGEELSPQLQESLSALWRHL